MEESHEEITWRKSLPRVGQTIRSRKDGTLWRVMEKREVWQNIEDYPETGEPRMIPAIYLSFWKIEEGAMPGVGKMVGEVYTLYDDTFKDHWEVMK
ncbi:MAG: hypothetical protein FJ243_01545 [Nitrospira sp.]|nr:hypothetical protein [Nitrospira sp.]